MKPILFVEDDHDDIWLVERAIKMARLEINPMFVVSFTEFKIYMEGRSGYGNRDRYPIPQLVFTDLKLEASSGFEVLAYMAGHITFGHIPVVILTTSGREEDRTRAMKSGAREFITKPYSNTDLIQVFSKVLRDHLFHGASVGIPFKTAHV
ncbi:MAG: response regulator receiver protein [Verrucomicrobiales bacterium]|nr:response regulator receiver protein [Verrucomicrobiales bacterium]